MAVSLVILRLPLIPRIDKSFFQFSGGTVQV